MAAVVSIGGGRGVDQDSPHVGRGLQAALDSGDDPTHVGWWLTSIAFSFGYTLRLTALVPRLRRRLAAEEDICRVRLL